MPNFFLIIDDYNNTYAEIHQLDNNMYFIFDRDTQQSVTVSKDELESKIRNFYFVKTLENWGLLENQNCKIAGDC